MLFIKFKIVLDKKKNFRYWLDENLVLVEIGIKSNVTYQIQINA